MTHRPLLLLLLLLLATAPAYADKPCEDLRQEIIGKLETKQVVGYRLDIVPSAKVGERKVVGRCEGGLKVIVYTRK